MHDRTRNLLEDFLCESLVGADHACREYQQVQIENKKIAAIDTANSNSTIINLANMTGNNNIISAMREAISQ